MRQCNMECHVRVCPNLDVAMKDALFFVHFFSTQFLTLVDCVCCQYVWSCIFCFSCKKLYKLSHDGCELWQPCCSFHSVTQIATSLNSHPCKQNTWRGDSVSVHIYSCSSVYCSVSTPFRVCAHSMCLCTCNSVCECVRVSGFSQWSQCQQRD